MNPIKTKAKHEVALKAAESLMAAAPHTCEGDALKELVSAIEAYEREHFPMSQLGLELTRR